MIITIYSFIMALVFFNLFVVVFSILQRRLDIYSGYNIYPVLFAVIITAVRLFTPIEFALTREINVDVILPRVQMFLQLYIQLGFLQISVFGFLVTVSAIISMVLLYRYIEDVFLDECMIQRLQSTSNKRLVALMEEVISETNVRAPYCIVTITNIKSPYICGFKRPVIVIPEKVLDLSDNDVRAVLHHEWRHYINKDLWIKTIVAMFRYIMWWNPAMHLLKRNLDKALEFKCDLDVTKHMNVAEKFEYVKSLYKLYTLICNEKFGNEGAAFKTAIPFVAASAQGAKSDDELYQRFQMLLPFEKRNHKISIACCGVIFLLFVASYGFVVQPYIRAPLDDHYEFYRGAAEDDCNVITGYFGYLKDVFILVRKDGAKSLYFLGDFVRYVEDENDFIRIQQIFGGISIIEYEGE